MVLFARATALCRGHCRRAVEQTASFARPASSSSLRNGWVFPILHHRLPFSLALSYGHGRLSSTVSRSRRWLNWLRAVSLPWRTPAGSAAVVVAGYCALRLPGSSVSRCSSPPPSGATSLPARPHPLLSTVEHKFTFFQQVRLVLRFFSLTVIFLPVVALYSLSRLLGSSYLADLAWRYTIPALQVAGPAFVKLGQWASTRRDLFSEDFCSTLSCLHTRCNPHSWSKTERILEENLGADWRELLAISDQEPIGSGCVAQVYKGLLQMEKMEGGTQRGREGERRRTSACASSTDRPPEAVGLSRGVTPHNSLSLKRTIPVAIKVLHPGVVEAMERDICLMKYIAGWVDYVYPDVHWVALKECVGEFTTVMQGQLDLKMEAVNLQRFKEMFHSSVNVRFPTPIQPYVTSSVLVESFEEGTLISEYTRNPGGKLQKNLARIGINVLLEMLFTHNFVHGDLHPGNILVKGPDDPKLVLLDCGIATSLGPLDLENFRAVFTAIVKGDGMKVADLMLGTQQCATKEEYRRRMAALVNGAIHRLNLRETQIAALFSGLFNILVEHKVRIHHEYTSVMMAVMVIEGLGRSLDPNMDILAIARPYLLQIAKESLGFRKRS